MNATNFQTLASSHIHSVFATNDGIIHMTIRSTVLVRQMFVSVMSVPSGLHHFSIWRDLHVPFTGEC